MLTCPPAAGITHLVTQRKNNTQSILISLWRAAAFSLYYTTREKGKRCTSKEEALKDDQYLINICNSCLLIIGTDLEMSQ